MAEYPSTCCMYRVSIRNIENIAVPMMKPDTLAPVTVLVRRIPKRMSGSGCLSSQPTKAARRASDVAKNASVCPASQPSRPASVIA